MEVVSLLGLGQPRQSTGGNSFEAGVLALRRVKKQEQ
jgi:hypothetical protein